MAATAYEVTIDEASWPTDGDTGLELAFDLHQAIRRRGGAPVDEWAYHFDTFDNAQDAATELKRLGLSVGGVRPVAAGTCGS